MAGAPGAWARIGGRRRARSDHPEEYELGGLSTGRPSFYERLGWLPWRGPLAVRTDERDVPMPEMRGAVLVLPTPRLPGPDLDAILVCDWRPGDVW